VERFGGEKECGGTSGNCDVLRKSSKGFMRLGGWNIDLLRVLDYRKKVES
jgi:hypothetical protein